MKKKENYWSDKTPPIRGNLREPRTTDASVVIGGATAVIGTLYYVSIDGKEHAIAKEVYELLVDLMDDTGRPYSLRSLTREAGKK
jgi:hypothetical protein